VENLPLFGFDLDDYDELFAEAGPAAAGARPGMALAGQFRPA
jgi:hypothetical protein